MSYILVAESLGISSTTFTQCAANATEFGEITQNKGHYDVRGHSRSPILVPIECSCTKFLLVLNTNSPPILHGFRDIAFDSSKIAISGYPSAFTPPPAEEFLCDDLRKNFPWMSTDGRGTKRRRINAENFNRLSRVHERYRQTDRRQTDGRQHVAKSTQLNEL